MREPQKSPRRFSSAVSTLLFTPAILNGGLRINRGLFYAEEHAETASFYVGSVRSRGLTDSASFSFLYPSISMRISDCSVSGFQKFGRIN